MSQILGAPMSEEDVRIVFNNIKDIARFSDRFAYVLEESLTDVLDGGEGEDYVGAVFVDAVCLPFQIIPLRQSLIVCLFRSFLIWKIYIRSTSQNIRQHYSTFLPFLELRRWQTTWRKHSSWPSQSPTPGICLLFSSSRSNGS